MSKEDQMKQIYTQTEPTITENRVQWVELIQATNIQTVTVHFSTQIVCKAIGAPRAHTWGIPGVILRGGLLGPNPTLSISSEHVHIEKPQQGRSHPE